MSELKNVADAASSLKVFPLPSGVLFPHSILPLNIFEPRYRRLVQDALQTDRVMALAQLLPGWETRYHGRPPMFPIAGAGVIRESRELPDGRYFLLLEGLVRVRIRSELPAVHPYREVNAELLLDEPYAGEEEGLLRQATLEVASRLPPGTADGLLRASSRVSGGALADLLAANTVEDADRRQELLSELDVSARLRGVLGELGTLLGRLGALEPRGLVH